jgi:hypothetical protein
MDRSTSYHASNNKSNNIPSFFEVGSYAFGHADGDFFDKVMSHLQASTCAEVNLLAEVQVKLPDGIDKATARVALANSRSLKADNSQIYKL